MEKGIVDSERLLAIGLDAGTGGVRALAMDLTRAHRGRRPGRFPRSQQTQRRGVRGAGSPGLDHGRPSGSAKHRRGAAGRQQDRRHRGRCDFRHLPLGRCRNRPLGPAIMYNDLRQRRRRSGPPSPAGRAAAYGIEIAAAFALPKILHLAATQPEIFGRCRRIVHQTDWIVGMLCRAVRRDRHFHGPEDRRQSGNARLAGADSPRPGASPRHLSRGGPSRHADRRGHGRRGGGDGPARRHPRRGRLHGRDRRLPGFRGGGRRRPQRHLGHNARLQGRGRRTAGRSGRRRLQPSPSGGRVSPGRSVEHRRGLDFRSFRRRRLGPTRQRRRPRCFRRAGSSIR